MIALHQFVLRKTLSYESSPCGKETMIKVDILFECGICNSNFKGALMYEITLIRHMLLKSPANIVELKKVVKTLVVFRRK